MRSGAEQTKAEGKTLLKIQDLSFRYPSESSDEPGILALEGIEVDVHEGEFVSIVGPSGCGKSTLLSVVGGLVSGFEGSVSIRGEEVRKPHPDIGVVFQEDSTFPWRNALRNVEFGLELRGVPKEERRRRAQEILRLFGLEGFEQRFPGHLSGGMKQRVAIARTLVLEPEILLMDEPFGALDEQTRIILGEELLRIQQELRQTVLFITHNIQESIMLSDRVVVLSARPGRIKAVMDVDFPRPRDSTLISSTHFAELVGKIWAVLRDESLKAFGQDSQKREAKNA